MDLIDSFIEKASKHPARIVYPEGGDERIVVAACKAGTMGIAEPIILGDPEEVQKIATEKNVSLDKVRIISPATDEAALNKYAEIYAADRGVKVGVGRKLVKKPLSFGGMMVKNGDADGMVAGVASATASVIQAAALTVGFQKGLATPSSFFIMIVPVFEGEKDKLFVFADCAVNIQPNARQLADIGVASGTNARTLLGMDPKIAFLSFSTKGSASHADVDKVIKAFEIAKETAPDLEIDGELQADAAIVARVAAKKVKESAVAGKANVLIFPDLDSANMCYKLVQYLAGAKAVGPILQGFAKPVNDMSRGASVADLIGVTAITVIQAGN
ncbi:MAG: phosphate acetyltransferase [Lentisphaerae bacterium]|nr:phosphate acetyltransferase [Lentisphaerota bacterium]